MQKKFTKAKKLVIVSCISLLLNGCASIMTGRYQAIPISSNPPGAKVIIDGNQTLTTPCTVQLLRKQNHVITIEKEGYESESVTLISVVSGAVAGNIILGGLIGTGIDAASGAAKKLTPESISVNLRPKVGPTGEKPKTVTERLNEIEQLKKEGKITEEEYLKLRENVLKEF